MTDAADQLPDDVASAHAMILAERAARRESEALSARTQALSSHSDALIARLTLLENCATALLAHRSRLAIARHRAYRVCSGDER